jgi:hypothetical protein
VTFRAIASVLLSLFLAACWVGKPFYAASEIRAPIPPGEYRSIALGRDSGKEEERVQVSTEADGLTRIATRDENEKASVMGFAPLDAGGAWFVGWMLSGDDTRNPGDDVAYFLLELEGGEFRFLMPNCDENRDIAMAAGASVEPDKKAALCRFADRSALEAAMRAAKDKLHDGVKLVLP